MEHGSVRDPGARRSGAHDRGHADGKHHRAVQGEFEVSQETRSLLIIVHPDCTRTGFSPRDRTILIAKMLRHLFSLVQSVFDAKRSWTKKGHADDVGTALEDALACEGSRMMCVSEKRALFLAHVHISCTCMLLS